MDGEKVAQYAHALYSAHGGKAEAEAARKVRECEEAGKPDEAGDWKAIRSAIHALRGPNQG